MERSSAATFRLASVSREEFIIRLAYQVSKEDSFARTFVSKADMLGLWPGLGAWEQPSGVLASAIAWSLTKRMPRVANLQLLHTFATSRRQGAARALCDQFLCVARESGATHWRVSAEVEAVPFYEALGIRFLGRQKSGCLLTVATIPLEGGGFKECTYTLQDLVARKAVYRKGKGGCVDVFEEK